MSRTLCYGDMISIDIPGNTTDRESIDAGTVTTVPFQQGQQSQIWTIVKLNNPDAIGPVKFGDIVYLRSATPAGYLSNDGRSNISISNTLTVWAIGSRLSPNSTDSLTSGDAIVTLGSMFGPCVSRKNVSDANPALTCNGAQNEATSQWVFTFVSSLTKALKLRYGNMISIRPSGQQDLRLLAALSTYVKDSADQNPSDITRAVTCDGVKLADSSRWTILTPDDLTAIGPLKYGDTVCLSASKLRNGGPPSPSSYYLSYRNDHLFDDGHRKIGAASAVGAWEKWKIIDPMNTGSTDQINFGDYFALKAEGGGGEYLTRPAAGGVSSSQNLSYSETWSAGNVFVEANSNPPDSSQLATSSDNSAAVLTFGMDVGRTVALGVIGGLASLLPGGGSIAGSVMGGLIGYFYPPSGANIWDIIKSHVEALVNDKIQEDKIQTFQSSLDAIKATLQEYANLETPDRKGNDLQDILNTLTTQQVQELKLGPAERVLPYLVTLGTLHISALHEMYLHGPEYFYPNYQDAVHDRAELKKQITYYSGLVADTKAKAIDWRKGQFSTGSDKTQDHDAEGNPIGSKSYTPYLIDKHRPNTSGLLFRGERDQVITWYKQNMVDIFSQQLEAFMIPAYLWRYMDPDCDEVPMKRPATAVTGLFGSGNGGEFFFYDRTSPPITDIWVYSGSEVDAFQFLYGGQGGKHGGKGGTGKWLQISPDMKIVKAWGYEEDQINMLYFGTDKGFPDATTAAIEKLLFGVEEDKSSVGGGTAEGGAKWNAEPPANADAFLLGASGNATDRLNTLYLHWQYDRWE